MQMADSDVQQTVQQTICHDHDREQFDEDKRDIKESMEMCITNEHHSNDARVFPNNHPSLSGMHAVLSTRDLWQKFDELNTEMIVTRRGRRMFPPIKVEVNDLKPSSFYVLLMDLVPVDKYRYKYQNSQWVKCFEETCSPTRLYVHPESPALGSYWMDHNVSFYKLKLTNNQLDKQGHIIVNSMHQYQPRLHIVESSDVQNLNWENFNTFEFPKTQFITVTAYQNDKITQLKIENNPFAKGFRSPMARIRMKPIKSMIRSASDTGSEDHGPIVFQNNGVVFVKRQRNTSGDDELPDNKKPFLQRDTDITGIVPGVTSQATSLKRVDSLSSLSSSMYKPANTMTHPSHTVVSLQSHNSFNPLLSYLSTNTRSELTSTVSNNSSIVQLVQLNPAQIHCSDISSMPSPNVITKFSETSSSLSEDSSDDSDSETSLTGTTKKSIHLPISKSNESLVSNANLRASHFGQIRQHNGFQTQIVLPSAMQPMISYQQPFYIQPNPDGRTQQILVPIATVPLTGPNNTNKISSGSPQGLYLQTCPIVQGALNSSQTLQMGTVPSCDQSQQLLHTSLPIYVNGQSTQLPSQSSQPIQIVTLANTPHVHS